MNLDILEKIKSPYKNSVNNIQFEELLPASLEYNSKFISFICPEGIFLKYCKKKC